MRYLIVSDIHGNREALEAVLNAAAGRYDQALCCGDLVGYGADPNAVVDWVREHVTAVVRGNHDRAAVGLDDLEWFNASARAAALWTGNELTAANTEYVRTLPRGPVAVENFHIVHGSPLDEDEYLMDPGEATDAFHYVTGAVTFFGHTHVQGGFVWRRSGVETIRQPAGGNDGGLRFESDACYLLNPGSVGQPRDSDARAAYILLDTVERAAVYGRTAYDVPKAQDKIRRAGLPAMLADRLALGR